MANERKVNTYLETLEVALRGELMKYTAIDHEEAIKVCGNALKAVEELKKQVTNVEDIKSAYLVV